MPHKINEQNTNKKKINTEITTSESTNTRPTDLNTTREKKMIIRVLFMVICERCIFRPYFKSRAFLWLSVSVCLCYNNNTQNWFKGSSLFMMHHSSKFLLIFKDLPETCNHWLLRYCDRCCYCYCYVVCRCWYFAVFFLCICFVILLFFLSRQHHSR